MNAQAFRYKNVRIFLSSLFSFSFSLDGMYSGEGKKHL